MYYANHEGIRSAVSANGLTWTDDIGIRVKSSDVSAIDLDSVAAPTVKIMDKWFMYYGQHTEGIKYTTLAVPK